MPPDPIGLPARSWVDAVTGLVCRSAFVDNDVYHLENERIFDQTWSFLGHITEIPEAGDYVSRNLGSAPVIVVRGDGGEVNVLLNSCRHRGAKVCRSDSGNTRRFVCPYHGWTYNRDGDLLTTTFDQHFPDGFDFSTVGLPRAPRVEVYKGLIFGCWNKDVAPLAEFLGEFAWYLDPFLCRTPAGMEVLAPPHRWRAKANWKVGALNFVGDSQHILTTHIGPLTLDPVRAARAGFATAAEDSFQVATDNGHGCTLTYLAPGLPDEAYQTHPADLDSSYKQCLRPTQYELLTSLRVIVGTVFPNLSFIETQVGPAQKAIILRQWRPISGTEMEVLSWILAEKESAQAYKADVLRKGFHNFGIAGVFEQDDLELWASATEASNNPISKRYAYSFHTALPYINRPEVQSRGPGRVFKPSNTEVAQLAFMVHWQACMKASA